MLPRSNILTMHNYNHGTSNRQTLSQSPVSMVRTTKTNHQRQRSPIYIPLRSCSHKRVGNSTKPIYSVPPPDRRIIRTEKSMDRTIPPTDHHKSRRLERLASCHYPSPQQLGKLHYRLCTQRTSYRMGTSINRRTRPIV